MAVGPLQIKAEQERLSDCCEITLDRMLLAQHCYTIGFSADMIGIDSQTWNDVLRKKYLDAGWKYASWKDDGNGAYIYFSMSEVK